MQDDARREILYDARCGQGLDCMFRTERQICFMALTTVPNVGTYHGMNAVFAMPHGPRARSSVSDLR